MDMDGPLDFESEDPLVLPSLPKPKRKKLIGLDDLLTDFYKEKSKIIEKESKKRARTPCDDSDDDDEMGSNKEALLLHFVDKCHEQVQGIKAEAETPLWGLSVFGKQKSPPPLDFPELENCSLLKSFMNTELNTLLELSIEKGQTFLEGLLIDGWLSEVVFTCGHVEESVSSWTINLMLYSSNEELCASAYDFWHAILTSEDGVGQRAIRIDRFPSCAELKTALETYGYLLDFSMSLKSLSETSHPGCDSELPAQNLRFWVKFLAVCFQARNKWPVFSIAKAEEFLGVILILSLDRRLQGLSLLLAECMLSATSSFTDDEWNISCKKVAKFLAHRTTRDLNCLRLVECIIGVGTRNKQLRSEAAFQILTNSLDRKVSDGEDILRLLISINLKDKDCDFFMVYINLVLTENWLFSNPVLEKKPLILEMWGVYLRNCSCQITSTDMRSYASKFTCRYAIKLHIFYKALSMRKIDLMAPRPKFEHLTLYRET